MTAKERRTEKAIICFECTDVWKGIPTTPEHIQRYEERPCNIHSVDTSWEVAIFSARCHVCMDHIEFGNAYIATVSDIN